MRTIGMALYSSYVYAQQLCNKLLHGLRCLQVVAVAGLSNDS